jgi:Cysteine-rich secretory protein family
MESRGKPNPGFPRLSTGLGNRSRDSHISTAPTPVRLVRNTKKKGEILGYRLRSLQAHLWIGKHCGADVVAAWAAEVTNYDHDKNTCVDPKIPCHHYTQVVWRNTEYVGCARAQDAERDIWVCDYDLPGNDVAVRPY